jgi:TolB-like protein
MDEQEQLLMHLQDAVRQTPEFARAEANDELIRLPTGDGMALVFFRDAEAPIRCALELSRTLRKHPDLRLRMGIHSGPVYRVADINANRNVAGGGINFAQRVMDCGDAGHILVSREVAEVLGQLSGWRPMLHDLGEVEVKHGVRIHIYNLYTDKAGNSAVPKKLTASKAAEAAPELKPAQEQEKDHSLRYQHASEIRTDLQRLKRETESDKTAPATTSSGSYSSRLLWGAVAAAILVGAGFLVWRYLRPHHSDAIPINSIAVLPFANASKDPEMDYLGEGISEEITNSLSRLPNLRVMARSTVSHYKLRQDDPQGVGHDLHVDAVLTGRVVEHGSELNVETELVNVATGAQLWGERYSRNANDALLLQAIITRDVASQLRPQLGGGQRERLAKIGTQNAEAYQLYLKGRYHLDKNSQEDYKTAARLFEKAVTLDEKYAAAYAGLADVYAFQAYFGYAPSREAFTKSRDAGRRALELDSEIPESHISIAISDMFFFHNLPEA